MTQVEDIGFSCSVCDKQYRWKPELAGKKVKCKCGQTVVVPTAPGGVATAPRLAPPPPPPKPRSDGEIDFDDLSALAAGAETASSQDAAYRCPSCQASLAPGSAICVHCGVDLRTGKRATTVNTAAMLAPAGGSATVAAPAAFPWGSKPRPAEAGTRGFTSDNVVYEGSKFRSLYLPLLLIGVGLIFYVGQLMMAGAEDKLPKSAIVGFLVVNFVADAVLIFLALIIAVKFLDMGFGALGPAVLKIFAIAIGPGAMGDIAYEALKGPMSELGAIITGSVVAIILYYTLIKVLFQLDLDETIRLTGVIYFLRRWVKTFILIALAGIFMASARSARDKDGMTTDGDESSDVMSADGDSAADEDVNDDEDAQPSQAAPAPTPAPVPAKADDNSGL